jgi:DNA-binding response OmpR family regulator
MDSDHDVLVVEDDADLNGLVGAYAQLAGLNFRSALDGKSALRQAAEKRPALILLDLMLPDIDGLEVCRRLKSDRRTANVPVVFLTALNRDHCGLRPDDYQPDDYLTKPFDPDHLIAAIRKHTTPR